MHKALKTPLTPSALNFFIHEGYEFCLFNRIYYEETVSAIILTPVKKRPDLKRLQTCESLFKTCEEPLKMVSNTDGPPVMIELGFDCLAAFVDYLLKNKTSMKIV